MSTDKIKTVTIDDREFCITKFDAKTGLKMARFVIEKMAPLIPMLDKIDEIDTEDTEGIYAIISSIVANLNDADIDYLVDHSLLVCSEKLPAGQARVLDETGHYGVTDVEDDPILTLVLCYHAIAWGASAFFGGKNSNLLKTLLSKVGKSQSRQTTTPS